MSKNYRRWTPTQAHLLPLNPMDWLPEDHLSYFLLDLTESLDLKRIEAKYQRKDGRGTRPYHPRMMTALLLYGYCVGMASSRRLEKATYEDIAVRAIVGENHPDHSRISEFRRKNLEELSGLFLQVLRLCQKAGLVRLGHVSLDGTKVKANASKHKAMSYGRMLKNEQELSNEIEQLLTQAEHLDQQEDTRFGAGRRGDELPEELRRREQRLEKIQEARKELEAEAAAERARELSEQQRNAEKHAAEEPDKGKRHRMEGRANLTRRKKEAAQEKARAKAREVGNNGELDLESRDPHEPPRHRVPTDKDGNPTDKAQRNFTDPESRIMKHNGAFQQGFNGQAIADGDSQVIVAADLTNQAPDPEHLRPMLGMLRENCGGLPERFSADAGYWSEANMAYCEGESLDAYIPPGRLKHGEAQPPVYGPLPKDEDIKGRMRRKLHTEEGKAIYARRKAIIEPVFGQIKQRLHHRFLLRSLNKARSEWLLYCLTHNLLKLHRAQLATG